MATTQPNQTSGEIPHLRRSGNTTQLIVDGQPFLILAGEVHNSSSSDLTYMEPVWARLVALHCNTALVPVSWELIEPQEGKFDFALVDGLVAAARRHGLRLVPLWFGTWKNATATYVPGWVKTNPVRFPRAQIELGRNGIHLSSLGQEACQADSRAFAALMHHIREIDRADHTVIMVQVENEVGILGASRDHSPFAEAAFTQPVPPTLLEHLRTYGDVLVPEVLGPWEAAGRCAAGIWAQVFSPAQAADELFMAWHIGRYVDQVAEAGQAEYPLPMYANAWLVQYESQEPGQYPSGGPVSRVMNVWQCAAPHISLLAPDIYLRNFAAICRSYTQAGNPLFIPEAHRDETAPANAFYALGQHGAIGFSPFGIEGTRDGDGLPETYRLLGDMMPILAEYQGSGRMVGVLQDDGPIPVIDLGNYHLHVQFNAPIQEGRSPAAGLIIAAEPDEFIVAGQGFSVRFEARPGEVPNVDFLWLYEGDYRAGKWIPGRRLNGDEYALRLPALPGVQRAKLYSYA